MTTHTLKTIEPHFTALLEGRKTFEVRSTADRTFAVGDTLLLVRHPFVEEDTRTPIVERVVSHVLTHLDVPYLVKEGTAILSFAGEASSRADLRVAREQIAILAEALRRVRDEVEYAPTPMHAAYRADKHAGRALVAVGLDPDAVSTGYAVRKEQCTLLTVATAALKEIADYVHENDLLLDPAVDPGDDDDLETEMQRRFTRIHTVALAALEGEEAPPEDP